METIYTEEEFLGWLAIQPAERPVNMFDGAVYLSTHSCVLAEFLKDKGAKNGLVSLNGDFEVLGNEEIAGKVELKRNIYDYFSEAGSANNFGQLQKKLRDEFK